MRKFRSDVVSSSKSLPNRLVRVRSMHRDSDRLTEGGERGGSHRVELRSDCGEVQLKLELRTPRLNASEAAAFIKRESVRWVRSLQEFSR